MTTALVTGASGFIGRRVAAAALQANLDVVGTSRHPVAAGSLALDLRGPLDPLPPVDWVFHLAGSYAGGNRMALEQADLRIAENLIDWGLRTGVRDWVFASAAEVYGRASVAATEEFPCRPVIPYGEIKLEIERLFERLTERKPETRVVALRIGEVYGRDGTLINELVRRLRSGFCPWFGDGRVPVSFVHVDDVARAFVAASREAPSGFSVVNVADDDPVEWRSFLDGLAERLHTARAKGLPLSLSHAYAAASSTIDRMRQRRPTLTRHIVALLTTPKALSNRRLREDFRCPPRYPTFEDGLSEVLNN